ncbi:MAG TPA: glutamate--tRNA ligase [Peptococcaceae bacterium]|jgi:nondiscriminating glutamyl-tRNA synthetase|nr:glutamate--tRNA ligase [Clostridia bacterium]HOB82680.1 glutamate--tRNA ligase [Peptococcaceae bacterium]HQD54767.1 glutamate--tRNA ligase [Peptococcaceae bacterium]
MRLRFAPSPTGPLHIGGARSALFNYLLAKKTGGKLILRIEDTDLARSSRESEQNIAESLKWLGISWDEGPDVGGPYGPYRQMERLEIYRQYTELLLEKGYAYYCYCSEEELEQERQEALAKGAAVKYSGKCFALTAEERAKLEAEGRKPVIRFHVPPNQEIVLDDLVRGRVVFNSEEIGDFVIVKSDGIPTYNYAVVIDDSLMKISHVIRAEEHLSNTPRQALLYQALGFPMPQFAHISLILGKDHTKMSKRHGATSVVQYKEEGYLPEAVVNFLALLGWAPEGEEEIFSLEKLIVEFSLERVAKNPAVFDLEKLRWINGMYIRGCTIEKLVELALPFLRQAGYVSENPSSEEMKWMELVMTALQERLSTIKEVEEQVKILLGEEVTLENEEAAAVLKEETAPLVIRTFQEKLLALEEITPETVKALLKSLTKELKLGGKLVYMPIRVALTGQMHGPDLYLIIAILGKELVVRRLKNSVV